MISNGDALRARRLTMGLTQAAAASRAGISQSNWSAHESGSRPLTDDMLARLTRSIDFSASHAVETHRERIRELCRAHHASSPSVFGSVAAGTATDRSDLDLAVVADPDMTMFDLLSLESQVQRLCGVATDIITDDALRTAGRDWDRTTMVPV